MVLRKDLIGHDQLQNISEHFPQYDTDTIKGVWAAVHPEKRTQMNIEWILKEAEFRGDPPIDIAKGSTLSILGQTAIRDYEKYANVKKVSKRAVKWLFYILLIVVATNCYMVAVMVYNMPILPSLLIVLLPMIAGFFYGYYKSFKK